MTAHALPGEKEKCMSFGMTDYISKPIREYELYNLIASYVDLGGKEKESTSEHDSSEDTSVVNLEYLTELSRGNHAFVEEMKKIFLIEIRQELRMLEGAIRKGDYESVMKVAHKIKSTIPFVGLNRILEDKLSEMELLAEHRRDLEKISSLFTLVRDVCKQATLELRKMLQVRSAR
jgi:HPt (histidine-containing phosphotransfer) domain-containing protein